MMTLGARSITGRGPTEPRRTEAGPAGQTGQKKPEHADLIAAEGAVQPHRLSTGSEDISETLMWLQAARFIWRKTVLAPASML